MMKQIIVIGCLAALLAGCQANKNTPEPIPEEFIVRQNTSEITRQLDTMNQEDYVVAFSRGKDDLSEHEKKKLTAWMGKHQPTTITVRGTAGSDKYIELGENRKISTISHILNQGYKTEIIPLDYDPDLAGGRALIVILSDDLAQQIRDNAPILMISPD